MNLTPLSQLILEDGLLLLGIVAIMMFIKWLFKPVSATNDVRGPQPCRSYEPALDEEEPSPV